MKQNRFSEFPKNNRNQEGLSNIFEDSSPKVFFWQVTRIFDFLSLSADSRYLQWEPLKYEENEAIFFYQIPLHSGTWNTCTFLV